MHSCGECAFSKPTPSVSAGRPAALNTLASEPPPPSTRRASRPGERRRLRADRQQRAVRRVPVAAERLAHVDLDVDAGRRGRRGAAPATISSASAVDLGRVVAARLAGHRAALGDHVGGGAAAHDADVRGGLVVDAARGASRRRRAPPRRWRCARAPARCRRAPRLPRNSAVDALLRRRGDDERARRAVAVEHEHPPRRELARGPAPWRRAARPLRRR